MKYLPAFLFGALLVFSACQGGQTPTESRKSEPAATARNYFPGGVNSFFEYSINAVDISTNLSTTFASQKSEIVAATVVSDTVFLMSNTLTMLGLGETNLYYGFRRSDFGVYLLADSNLVLSQISLPDSLFPDGAEFQIDPEIILFSYPLFENKSWNAYQLNIVLGGISYVPLISIKAYYEGTENVSVPAFPAGQAAEKIRYGTSLLIPDLADTTSNLPQFNKTELEFYAWFAKDIGIIKFEAGPAFSRLLAQNVSLPGDSTTVLSWELSAYELK